MLTGDDVLKRTNGATITIIIACDPKYYDDNISIHHQYTSSVYIISIYHQYISSVYIISIHHHYTSLVYIISIHHQYTSSVYIISIHHQYTLSLYVISIHHQYTSLVYIISIRHQYISSVYTRVYDEYIHEFNFLGLTPDSSLSFKFHLTKIGNKISRVIGLLHKLKHIFPPYLLRMIYNSLILPHMNYSLLVWGANCYSIELLQKKTVRVINFKSPLAHTEPILKGMNQLKLPDMYTCHLIKIYYKLHRNKLPTS